MMYGRRKTAGKTLLSVENITSVSLHKEWDLLIWHLLTLKYMPKSPIKTLMGALFVGPLTWNFSTRFARRNCYMKKKGSTTSSMIQTKLLYTEQSCLLNNLYYQSLQHILVEGGILSQISRKSGFKTLVSGKYSMTQLASFFLKTILKYPLFMKVKNTKKTNFDFKRNYMASSKCTVNHECLLLLHRKAKCFF